MMNLEDKTLIWHVDTHRLNLQLLRVMINQRTTRLDFGYQTTDYYIRGGWINIYPETHLVTSASSRKMRMQDQQGIVTAPDRFHFKSRADWQFFSLFFAPLPIQDQTISLVESEDPDFTNFNIGNIELKLDAAFLMRL
jgi:hypothetical protein